MIWWQVSAKKWFTGPKHTIDEAVVEAFASDLEPIRARRPGSVGAAASSSRRSKSGPSNSATARSYFSIPHDQKSKSIGLAAAWIEAHSVQPYFAISPSSRARATLCRRCRP